MPQDQSALLEELQARHQAAQVRLQEATQTFQQAQQAQAVAQATFQKAQQALVIAQQQFQGWTVAVSTVAAEEASRQQAAKERQLQLPNTPSPTPPAQPEPIEAAEPTNKTDMIRELLGQHPLGMTPTEIWNQVHDRFKHRAYLYSVLKRLTDREELCVRRGKYALKIKPQEVRTEPGLAATIQ